MKMIAIPLALMLASAPVVALQSSAAYAQDMSQGADNFYKSDRVTIEKVTFRNKLGMKVVGNLFVPKNLDRSARTPAIIVGHPMGAVKEQSSNLYAQKLAEQGFVTLSFDLSFWGESEGQPRHTVAPEIYADDFSAAVDFLSASPFVNKDNIGVLGICGSGSFALSAAQIDPRMKAIATVSMYDMGAAYRDGLNKSVTVEQRKVMLEQSAEQRYSEFAGGEAKFVGGTVLELTAELFADRARVLRFLPHVARGGNSRRRLAADHHQADLVQHLRICEFLSVRRDRDDLPSPAAVHHRQRCAFDRVQPERLQACV